MKTAFTDHAYPFLHDGGEMGELTRRYDWSTSPLVGGAQWPISLRTLINMMLTSRFPMLIFWGPELITVSVYLPSSSGTLSEHRQA